MCGMRLPGILLLSLSLPYFWEHGLASDFQAPAFALHRLGLYAWFGCTSFLLWCQDLSFSLQANIASAVTTVYLPSTQFRFLLRNGLSMKSRLTLNSLCSPP